MFEKSKKLIFVKIVFWEEISWNKVSSKETPINEKYIHSITNHITQKQ